MASADAVEIDGIYYNLVKKAKIAEVTENPNHYLGEINIPEKVTYEDTEYAVTSIGDYAFAGAEFGKIVIPGSVETIGKWSFGKCYELTSITLPEGLVSIGEQAFYDDSKLISIVLPDSLKEIGNRAFESCTNLTSITIGTNLESIGNDAFSQCEMLSTINISDISSWCQISFKDNPLRYAHTLSLNGKVIKDLVIPEGVDRINKRAFIDYTNLQSISFPISLHSIGYEAFQNCTNLTKLSLPDNVESLDVRAFSGCISLSSVTLGSGVNTIEQEAFGSCKELSEVYCYAEKVPFGTDINAFVDSYINYATLYVPENSIAAYKEKSPWKDFKEILPLKGTKIDSITLDSDDKSVYYNLKGQMVDNPQKGLFIRNNKKIVIK